MKNIGVIITIVLALCGSAVGYGKLINSTDNVRKRVEEIKNDLKTDIKEKSNKMENDIEKHDDEIHELQNFNMQQSVLIETSLKQIESNSKLIQKIDEKIDKKN